MLKFEEVLKEGGRQCSTPLTLFLDGVDLLEDAHQARTMDWLPHTLPEVGRLKWEWPALLMLLHFSMATFQGKFEIKSDK